MDLEVSHQRERKKEIRVNQFIDNYFLLTYFFLRVPSIVFVSSPTQDIMPYDMRFWKIAFDLPNTERIKDVIGYGYWENINPWKSSLAPGGSL